MLLSEHQFSGIDKRDHVRYNIEAEITCRLEGTEAIFSGYSKNMCMNGIQFETKRFLKEGEILQADIETKNSVYSPLKVTLKVLRVQKNSNLYLTACSIEKVLE